MIQGEKYSYPSDCWSYGILLHELMSLSPPFYKHETSDLVKSILIDPPPELPNHYSSELKTISKLFLSKKTNHRLGFAAMLLDPFIALKVNSFPIQYRPKSLEERIRRAHTKQLQAQLEYLRYSTCSSLTSIPELLKMIDDEQQDLIKLAAESNTAVFNFTLPSAGEILRNSSSIVRQASKSSPRLSRRPSLTVSASVANTENELTPVRSEEKLDVLEDSIPDHVMNTINETAEHDVDIENDTTKELLSVSNVDFITPTKDSLASTSVEKSSTHGGRKGIAINEAKETDQLVEEAVISGQLSL